MSFVDKELTCKDCGQEFVFTAGEQQFYAEKGFENIPGRCPSCRSARKNQSRGGYGNRAQREMFTAVCASCGVETQVPFKPNGLKPVYCRDCFQR
ncbi:MAG TPA: zinc-binding protein [Firmicutes bacterium]|mgnify:CR=1 FL=1|nr:zinc-binding protein [Bacillota bacterium]